jgi:hypothetical protein
VRRLPVGSRTLLRCRLRTDSCSGKIERQSIAEALQEPISTATQKLQEGLRSLKSPQTAIRFGEAEPSKEKGGHAYGTPRSAVQKRSVVLFNDSAHWTRPIRIFQRGPV